MVARDYAFWHYNPNKYLSGQYTKEDDVIYHLDSISLELRIVGTYYEYIPGVNSEIAGLYYVFGLNEDAIKDLKFFIPELIERKNTNKVIGNKVLLDVNFVKIDLDNPMKTFDEFLYILRGMIAVQFFCRNICDLPYPDVIPENLLTLLLKLHYMFKCQENNPKAERQYMEDVLFMGGNLISSYIKSEKYSLVRKIFCGEKFSHKIHLLTHTKSSVKKAKRTYSGELSTIKVPTKVWYKFKQEVSAYPELFYYVVKKENVDANYGVYAVKRSYRDLVNCRFSHVIIRVPRPYLAKFSFILHNCVFEDYGTCNPAEILEKGETFGAFYIPFYFYYEFTKLAKRNRVDYAMDKQYVLDSKPDFIPILVPYKDINRVNTILNTYECDTIKMDYTHGRFTINNTYYLEETKSGDRLPLIRNVPFVHLSVLSAPYSFSNEPIAMRKREFSSYVATRNKACKMAEKHLNLKTIQLTK